MANFQRRGRFFEELNPGDVFTHVPGRTIGEADTVWFSAITMNTNSLHVDESYAQTTLFGTRLVNSILTLGIVVGLSTSELGEGTAIANLGFENVHFPNPVFIGDTIRSSTTILSKRLSNSRPGAGVVQFRHHGANQNGVDVCVADRWALVACQGDES